MGDFGRVLIVDRKTIVGRLYPSSCHHTDASIRTEDSRPRRRKVFYVRSDSDDPPPNGVVALLRCGARSEAKEFLELTRGKTRMSHLVHGQTPPKVLHCDCFYDQKVENASPPPETARFCLSAEHPDSPLTGRLVHHPDRVSLCVPGKYSGPVLPRTILAEHTDALTYTVICFFARKP